MRTFRGCVHLARIWALAFALLDEALGFARDDSQVRGAPCSRGYGLELGPTHRV